MTYGQLILIALVVLVFITLVSRGNKNEFRAEYKKPTRRDFERANAPATVANRPAIAQPVRSQITTRPARLPESEFQRQCDMADGAWDAAQKYTAQTTVREAQEKLEQIRQERDSLPWGSPQWEALHTAANNLNAAIDKKLREWQ